ncbi:MAG: tetratricopeptide repeat protein [Actinomycetes bacterium]
MISRKRRIEQLGEYFVEGQRELHEGSVDRAVEIFAELAGEWADFDGPDCERALTMRGFLGRALTDARRFTEAEEVLADLLLDRERVLGPDDEQTLVARGNLMRAIAFGGHPREAIVMAERLIEDRTRIYGPDDISVHRMAAHIARFHYELDEYAEAAARYEAVLEAFERLGLDDTSEFAEMSYNAVVAAVKADPNDETFEAFAEMVEEIEAELGPDQPWSLAAAAMMAEVLAFFMDRPEEGLERFQTLVDRRTALHGAASPQTLETRRALGDCLIAMGRPGEAVAQLADGVRACEEIGYAREVGGLHTRMDLIWARIELITRLDAMEDRGVEGDEEIAEQWRLAAAEFEVLLADTRTLEPDHGLRVAIEDMGREHGLLEGDEPDPSAEDWDADDDPPDTFSGRAFDDRHMVHYRFGFGAIPAFVFDEAGLGFLHTLDGPGGPELLAQLWASLCDDPMSVCAAHEFTVEQRRGRDGALLVVIGLPAVRSSHECHAVGIWVDMVHFSRRFSETGGLPSLREPGAARVLHLEAAGFGGTVVGETLPDGTHLNLGPGPEPSVEVMFSILGALGPVEPGSAA